MIDLMPVIQEILILEVPMQVFCTDSSEEGAPQSGKDWEVIQERDKEERIDPRLAGLAQFFKSLVNQLLQLQFRQLVQSLLNTS